MKPLGTGMLGRLINRYHDRMMTRIDDAEREVDIVLVEEKRKYEQEQEQKISGDDPWLGPNLGLTSHGPGLQDPGMALFEQLTGGPEEEGSATEDDEDQKYRQELIRKLREVVKYKLEGKDLPFGF